MTTALRGPIRRIQRATRLRALVSASVLALAALAPAARASAAEMTVSGAASLTAAFGAIAEGFGKAHAGTTVRTNFAGSSTLVQQIREGAPVDVFASADESNMQKLVDAGDVAGVPGTGSPFSSRAAIRRGSPVSPTSRSPD